MEVGIKSAVEKLKRKIKRKRGWLLAGMIPIVAVAAGFLYPMLKPDENSVTQTGLFKPVAANLEESSGSEVVLHKIFVCGEQFESLGFHTEADMDTMMRVNPGWKLEGIDGNKVVYAVEVEDLSPECRRNAYFGLDHNNSLTLYVGKPGEGKVVRTFFQVNIEHLENSLPQETVSELREGIRITDFAEYNSVLSTFSDYALDEAEQVVKPAEQ